MNIKPNIKKHVDGRWLCDGLGVNSLSLSPKEAYVLWLQYYLRSPFSGSKFKHYK